MEQEKEWEKIAAIFHETYERLAPRFNYKTRPESAVAWEMVKEPNRRLMTATVAEIMPALLAEATRRGIEQGKREAWEEAKMVIEDMAVDPNSGGFYLEATDRKIEALKSSLANQEKI